MRPLLALMAGFVLAGCATNVPPSKPAAVVADSDLAKLLRFIPKAETLSIDDVSIDLNKNVFVISTRRYLPRLVGRDNGVWEPYRPGRASFEIAVNGKVSRIDVSADQNLKVNLDRKDRLPYVIEIPIGGLLSSASLPTNIELKCLNCGPVDDLPKRMAPIPNPPMNSVLSLVVTQATLTQLMREAEVHKKVEASEARNIELARQREQERIAKEGDGSPDDLTCKKYGFKPSTEGYAQCRLQIDIAKKDATQRQAAYQEQKRQYDAQVAAVEKERERRQGAALMEYGVRLMGGQSPANAAVNVGTGAPITPPTLPMTNQTYMLPGGRMMNCTTAGTVTNCY